MPWLSSGYLRGVSSLVLRKPLEYGVGSLPHFIDEKMTHIEAIKQIQCHPGHERQHWLTHGSPEPPSSSEMGIPRPRGLLTSGSLAHLYVLLLGSLGQGSKSF